ncbi:g2270 [Coccomyxa viridis]|uniref:G2270 protein n=1 Tax=Coccomyxa viridis TaxID=1274662 RepID=A0ABP1FJZ9_9CHLO
MGPHPQGSPPRNDRPSIFDLVSHGFAAWAGYQHGKTKATIIDAFNTNTTTAVNGMNSFADKHGKWVADGMRDAAETFGQSLKDSAHIHGIWVGGLYATGTILAACIPLLKRAPK